jgi:alkanesulfonate monooxygenase SsuD/methylene tetrahydromethanopterin reductase-like flavin-dependent oxidoreductase (luciferase family)
MGTGDDANGLWGTPDDVAERLRRRVELGCTLFVVEFFGRDTRVPARLFAESVIPAFR